MKLFVTATTVRMHPEVRSSHSFLWRPDCPCEVCSVGGPSKFERLHGWRVRKTERYRDLIEFDDPRQLRFEVDRVKLP